MPSAKGKGKGHPVSTLLIPRILGKPSLVPRPHGPGYEAMENRTTNLLESVDFFCVNNHALCEYDYKALSSSLARTIHAFIDSSKTLRHMNDAIFPLKFTDRLQQNIADYYVKAMAFSDFKNPPEVSHREPCS